MYVADAATLASNHSSRVILAVGRQAFQEINVTVGRSLDRVIAAGDHITAVPRAVDALEMERTHTGLDPTHGLRGQWNQVWKAIHETQITLIHDDRQRIALARYAVVHSDPRRDGAVTTLIRGRPFRAV
jgi:hypothetical protein